MFFSTQTRQPRTKVTTTMPIKGQNEVFIPQLIDPSQATLINNYFIRRETELEKRRGSKNRASTTGGASRILELWTETLIILGYDTTLSVFNLNDNTINSIKTDFTQNVRAGKRLGFDFYSCNGRNGEKIFKTTLPTLAYDTQTVNFAVGDTLTGGTSGATAVIITDTDAGATGTLELDNINGVFQNNETITSTSGGSADANGVVTYTNTAVIAAAPKCNNLHVFDKSLIAISTDTDITQIQLSKQNDTSDWTNSTVYGNALHNTWSFAGEAVSAANIQSESTGLESEGSIVVVFYKDGYAAFNRTIEELGGVQSQVFPTIFEKINDGGEIGAISLPGGIAFGNENGIFLLSPNGERINLLRNMKRSRIRNINFTDMDLIWDSEEDRLYATVSEAATVNNKVFWFDTRTLSSKTILWGELSGLAISRFVKIGRTLLGASATIPKVIELFPENVYDDEGVDVFYRYNQPLNLGELETVKEIDRVDVAGFLSPTVGVTVKIRGFNETGVQTDTDIRFSWITTGGTGVVSGYSEAAYGDSGYADSPAPEGTVWFPAYTEAGRAYNFKSYSIEFSGNDKNPHIVSYASIRAREGRLTRENGLQLT